jgi:hypothetical protein
LHVVNFYSELNIKHEKCNHLENLKNSNLFLLQVVAPMALFHVDSRGQLMPIAIQLFPNSAAKQHPVIKKYTGSNMITLLTNS